MMGVDFAFVFAVFSLFVGMMMLMFARMTIFTMVMLMFAAMPVIAMVVFMLVGVLIVGMMMLVLVGVAILTVMMFVIACVRFIGVANSRRGHCEKTYGECHCDEF